MRQTKAHNEAKFSAAMAERRRLLALVPNKFAITQAKTAWGREDVGNLITRMVKSGLIVQVERGTYQKRI